MSKNKIKIIAYDVDQFKSIEEKLSKLPESILSQIEKAEVSLIGLECLFKTNMEDKLSFFIPSVVDKIIDFDNFIGIYCKDYFFTIRDENYSNKKISYLFIECSEL